MPCARNCGRDILPGERWHLDHRDSGVGYRGPSHAECNIRGATAKRVGGDKAPRPTTKW